MGFHYTHETKESSFSVAKQVFAGIDSLCENIPNKFYITTSSRQWVSQGSIRQFPVTAIEYGIDFLFDRKKKEIIWIFIINKNAFMVLLTEDNQLLKLEKIKLDDIIDIDFAPQNRSYWVTLRYNKEIKVVVASQFPLGPEKQSVELLDTLRRLRISKDLASISRAALDDSSYDCFISYASEDKVSIALPLATQLRDNGLRVWFDQFSLKVGDSIRKKIDEGLAHCLFGIVILSKHFFEKKWPQYELDGLVSKEMSANTKLILPVWHEITLKDIQKHSVTLAGKLALGTADMKLEEIANEISEVVNDRKREITDQISGQRNSDEI